MPQGPKGAPRLTNLGPLSRSTEEEIRQYWEPCPTGGEAEQICIEAKKVALAILENQDFFAKCDDLVDINSGSCASVAERVFEQVEGVRIYKGGDKDHVWIEYNGKHYDAEAPTGVDNYKDLPFFKRLPHDMILQNAQMQAEVSGETKPTTLDDTVEDITQKYTTSSP